MAAFIDYTTRDRGAIRYDFSNNKTPNTYRENNPQTAKTYCFEVTFMGITVVVCCRRVESSIPFKYFDCWIPSQEEKKEMGIGLFYIENGGEVGQKLKERGIEYPKILSIEKNIFLSVISPEQGVFVKKGEYNIIDQHLLIKLEIAPLPFSSNISTFKNYDY